MDYGAHDRHRNDAEKRSRQHRLLGQPAHATRGAEEERRPRNAYGKVHERPKRSALPSASIGGRPERIRGIPLHDQERRYAFDHQRLRHDQIEIDQYRPAKAR